MRKFEYVTGWTIEEGKGVVINGEVLPYAVMADGPMVERIDHLDDLHILWLPLLAEGPCPRAGRPDGEPTTPTETPTSASGAESRQQ